MSVKKMVAGLMVINLLQFCLGLIIWIVLGNTLMYKISIYVYLTLGVMLFSTFITILGLYFASRYKEDNFTDSLRDLEELNTRLRTQRHDYLNHFQVIYGLMELGEYEEAKRYIDPVFKDIMKVSKALKTAHPAVNALLQAKTQAAEQKKIDFFLEIRSDLKGISLEPWNLCKVLANIIDNGITALSESDQAEKKLCIEIGEEEQYYTIRIYNNGPEISKNLLENIFKQGYSTKKEQDHGMGLYIVAQIIREAGGTIQVSSSKEKTSFYLELPKAA